MKKVAVLGSGNGSNFEAIIKYFCLRDDIQFVCASDKSDSYILERAKRLGVQSYYVPFNQTLEFLKKYNFDLVVLAGYMRILPEKVVKYSKIINIHPSLLPDFKGKDAIKRAYESGVKETGVTIHYVDEGIDTGSVIAQAVVPIENGINIEELEKNVHKAEHELYPNIIEFLLFDKPVKLDNIVLSNVIS